MIWGILSANCTSVFRWHFFFFKTPEQGWRKAASDTSVKSTHSPSQKFLKGQIVDIYADCPIQTLLGLPAVWLGTKAKPAPQQQRLCPSRELHLNARLILASDRSNMALTPPPSTFHLLWYLKGQGSGCYSGGSNSHMSDTGLWKCVKWHHSFIEQILTSTCSADVCESVWHSGQKCGPWSQTAWVKFWLCRLPAGVALDKLILNHSGLQSPPL